MIQSTHSSVNGIITNLPKTDSLRIIIAQDLKLGITTQAFVETNSFVIGAKVNGIIITGSITFLTDLLRLMLDA